MPGHSSYQSDHSDHVIQYVKQVVFALQVRMKSASASLPVPQSSVFWSCKKSIFLWNYLIGLISFMWIHQGYKSYFMSQQKCINVSDTAASIKDKIIHILEIHNKKNFIHNYFLLSQLTIWFILYFIPRFWTWTSEALQNDFLQILLCYFFSIFKDLSTYLCRSMCSLSCKAGVNKFSKTLGTTSKI